MTTARSDFDLDLKAGAQAELFVAGIRDSLAKGSSSTEVKAPKPFLPTQRAYVELECRTRAGVWRKSGLSTTKAGLWVFTFGALPGGLVVETEWLRRAAEFASQYNRLRAHTDLEPNPTRGVLIGLSELWKTREGNP